MLDNSRQGWVGPPFHYHLVRAASNFLRFVTNKTVKRLLEKAFVLGTLSSASIRVYACHDETHFFRTVHQARFSVGYFDT